MHSVVTVECHAPALDRAVTYTALVPEAGTPPFAVLYQLHGASDDHRAWLYKSNLLRHVDGLPLVVVLPSGENSYYVDALGAAGRATICPAHVSRTFRVREGRAAIGGLSMGGFGAIRLGLKYRRSLRVDLRALVEAGGDAATTATRAVSRRASTRKNLPALAFDCGERRSPDRGQSALPRQLEALGLPHEYREHPGAHTWDYWERHLPDAIAHHARVLGLG